MYLRFRQAVSRIFREKATFALIVTALGLALSAVICALAFARLVISQPLPYPLQERLVVAQQVVFDQADHAHSNALSYPAAMLLHDASGVVFDAKLTLDAARDVVVSHPAQPLVSVSYTAGDYAKLFAPSMAIGRFPNAAELLDESPVAAISYSAWQSLFQRREDVLGQRLRIAGGKEFEVVGVTAADFIEPQFHGPGRQTQIWLPWKSNPSPEHWGWASTTETLVLAGRLAEGVTKQQAADRLSVLLNARWRTELGTSAGTRAGWSTQVKLIGAQQAIGGSGVDAGLLMLAGTLGLILVVLVNVTHLLVARVAERTREFSIQMALGARRSQLFGLVLIDMLLLMLPAAVLAMILAEWGFTLMQRDLNALLPRIEELYVGPWTIALTLGFALLLAVALAGIAFAQRDPPSGNGALNMGRSATSVSVSGRIRWWLMASQVGVAGLLIACNAALIREASSILNERGIELDQRSSAFLYQLPSQTDNFRPASPATAEPLEQQLLDLKRQLAALPAVKAVSQSHSPLQDFIKTAVSDRSGTQYSVELKRVDNHYLDITAQRLAFGRNFTATEIASAANVALVNTAMAKQLERKGSMLGASLTRSATDSFVVVGVVDELSHPGVPASAPHLYLPASQSGTNFILQFQPGQRMSRAQLVEFVASVKPGLGVFLYDDLSAQRANILLPRRITAMAASAVALIVMLASAIGLYGMVRYSTRLRRAEIGARLAFGAKSRHIVVLLIRNNLTAVCAGCLTSAVLALAFIPALMVRFGIYPLAVRGLDATLAVIALVIFAVAACYLSARTWLSRSPASVLNNNP